MPNTKGSYVKYRVIVDSINVPVTPRQAVKRQPSSKTGTNFLCDHYAFKILVTLFHCEPSAIAIADTSYGLSTTDLIDHIHWIFNSPKSISHGVTQAMAGQTIEVFL